MKSQKKTSMGMMSVVIHSGHDPVQERWRHQDRRKEEPQREPRAEWTLESAEAPAGDSLVIRSFQETWRGWRWLLLQLLLGKGYGSGQRKGKAR